MPGGVMTHSLVDIRRLSKNCSSVLKVSLTRLEGGKHVACCAVEVLRLVAVGDLILVGGGEHPYSSPVNLQYWSMLVAAKKM